MSPAGWIAKGDEPIGFIPSLPKWIMCESGFPLSTRTPLPDYPGERNSVSIYPVAALADIYRLVYCGAFLARLRPGFLRSFSLGSRVKKPALRKVFLRFGSTTSNALATP